MRNSFSKKNFWLISFMVLTLLQIDNQFLFSQPILKDAYEGFASVPTKNENYVTARKKAVAFAMKNAMELAFKDLMGEEEFAANQRDLKKIVRRAGKSPQCHL